VYGAGRSNDVPNLPDGKFFIGSTGNTQESAYGLPTTDPSNNETLVYNSTTDAFEAGYPISDGQQSVFTANSTASFDFTGTGVASLSFGGILGGFLTFDQELRAGWSMGFNAAATSLNAFPPAVTSYMSISATFEVTAPVGALGTISLINPTGCWASLSYTNITFIGNGVATEYTASAPLAQVYAWQLANTLDIQRFILSNPGTITIAPKTLTVTVNHA
jgi:hypothetical protein